MGVNYVVFLVVQMAALPLTKSRFLDSSHVILFSMEKPEVDEHKEVELKRYELQSPESNPCCKTKWEYRSNDGGFPTVIKVALLQNPADDEKNCETVQRKVLLVKKGYRNKKYRQHLYRLEERRVTVAWKLKNVNTI